MGRVLLLNLGGPDQLNEVGPFCCCFPIPIPLYSVAKTLAWFIATRRTKTSQENYRQIGVALPYDITEAKAQALQEKLVGWDKKLKLMWGCVTGIRLPKTIASIKRDRIDHLVISLSILD